MTTKTQTRLRPWLYASSAAIVLAAATPVLLNWPGTARATSPNAGWVTEKPTPQAFFQAIRILALTDADGDDAKVKIVAREPADVYVVHNTVAPGGNSGWHTHPGPSVVVVKTGTATVYDADESGCQIHTYTAGSGFVDSGGGHVHLVANAGSATLELYAFQVIPHGEARVISVAQPLECPVL